ncbi:MAG TPA: hypothetical protein VLP43_00785 [Solirubrobacteraceae bacterium]|nr:hypothetical protein [Solirubrobacteraceae bacterium]
MSDDWRLRVDLHAEGAAHELLEHLAATRLEHDLSSSFHDRVVVSRDGAEVFCYAGTRDQAEHAEHLIVSLAAEHGWRVDTELKRWHPTAEDWEDPDTPLPQSASDQAGERAALMERERQEGEQLGYLEWEARVECRSYDDAVEFAERLRSEGVPNLRRSQHLLIGAADEDSANTLATRLRALAPAGSTVAVEATQEAAYAELPPNPFVIFGGLGG